MSFVTRAHQWLTNGRTDGRTKVSGHDVGDNKEEKDEEDQLGQSRRAAELWRAGFDKASCVQQHALSKNLLEKARRLVLVSLVVTVVLLLLERPPVWPPTFVRVPVPVGQFETTARRRERHGMGKRGLLFAGRPPPASCRAGKGWRRRQQRNKKAGVVTSS